MEFSSHTLNLNFLSFSFLSYYHSCLVEVGTMVKVEIVDEKETNNSPYASSSSSHSASTESLDSVVSEPEAESFYDRLAALVDIILARHAAGAWRVGVCRDGLRAVRDAVSAPCRTKFCQ